MFSKHFSFFLGKNLVPLKHCFSLPLSYSYVKSCHFVTGFCISNQSNCSGKAGRSLQPEQTTVLSPFPLYSRFCASRGLKVRPWLFPQGFFSRSSSQTSSTVSLEQERMRPKCKQWHRRLQKASRFVHESWSPDEIPELLHKSLVLWHFLQVRKTP